MTHTRAGAIVLVVGCAAGAWMAMDYAGLWVERIVASSALADANLVHRQSKRLSSRSRKRLHDIGQRAMRSQDYLSLPVTASDCIECDVCMERCPFEVDIIGKMQRAVEVFGQ